MGLPQELVDHTMDMLHDDIPALKACSLTCKAMFASTRRLIHQTLHLTLGNSLKVLIQEEKPPYERDIRDVELHLLSFMGGRGLLKYTQRVHISTLNPFAPEILLPHLRHFQSLSQVHSLTIDRFFANKWVNYHSTGFAHFYPTLTSLTLNNPCNHDRLLNFALRFPNLENLSLEGLRVHQHLESGVVDTATPQGTPPLRGCLRLAGYGSLAQLSTAVFHEPPKGFNFRSVELCNFPGSQARHVLSACAQTLEILTIKAYSSGNILLPFLPPATADRFSDPSIVHTELRYLKLTEMAFLRRLTIRTTFNNVFLDLDSPLLGMLSTIVSPVFCEFVLELGGTAPPPERRSMKTWTLWRDFDNLFEERFARHGDFRLVVIITSEPSDWEDLRRKAEWGFPLLAERGCIYLETSHPI